MHKTKLISIVLTAVFIGGIVAYLAWRSASGPTQNQPVVSQPIVNENTAWQSNSLSSVYIYSPQSKVKIYLYAPDQKESKVGGDYCGGKAGATVYRGNYELVLDPSTATPGDLGNGLGGSWRQSILPLGEMEFIQNTEWDGSLRVDTLDMKGWGYTYILLYTYGSCNANYLHIYGYDFTKRALVQYRFIERNGIISNAALVGPNGVRYSPDGISTSFYDNAAGKQITTSWVLDWKVNMFQAQ